eukprot:2992213-Rhodomonas_salina.1
MAYLRCIECWDHFCSPCLGPEKGVLWDIGLSCPGPACLIESAKWQEEADKEERLLEEIKLSESALQSLGASLKPGTWLRYHRHVGEFLHWCQERGQMCFPVVTLRDAWGIARFF